MHKKFQTGKKKKKLIYGRLGSVEIILWAVTKVSMVSSSLKEITAKIDYVFKPYK